MRCEERRGEEAFKATYRVLVILEVLFAAGDVRKMDADCRIFGE